MSHSRSLCVSLGLLSIGASQIPLCIKISVKDSWQPHVQESSQHIYSLQRAIIQTGAAEKCQTQNRALPEKILGSWLWELGNWKWLGFGMVLSTLKNKVMFIYSPLLWLLMRPLFQAPFPSNFWIGFHWSCFPCLALPPSQAKWEGNSLPWCRKIFGVRQWVEHHSGTFMVFWIFVLSCALLLVLTHLEYLVFLEQTQMCGCLEPRRNWSLDPATCSLIREKQFRLGFWEGRVGQWGEHMQSGMQSCRSPPHLLGC